MNQLIILTDADNTLWDTNSVYAEAQIGLLSWVEKVSKKKCVENDRLYFVRSYDQALAEAHHAHLKYPPMLLVRALILGLDGVHPTAAATLILRGDYQSSIINQSTVETAVEKYFKLLGKIPNLLPTVSKGLEAIHSAHIEIFVLTEGKSEKQKNILSHHSLNHLVAGVFEVVKNKEQFARLIQRFSPAEVIIIGDQPDRDITPAKQSGCTAILVPSQFRPNWHNEEEYKVADFVAPNFEDAVKWALRRSSLQ